MGIVALNRIKLGATVTDKKDAIRQAGELLVTSGAVAPNYVNGMLAREETMSTYLGEGVAIPHGQYENREEIFETGISVLQVPAGVLWEEDDDDEEKAYLIIGIAASEDEHIGVLSKLAEAIEEEEIVEKLRTTTDPEDVLAILGE